MMNGGFMAGTLVYTKDGLVPIEQIRVGDWVFSKSKQNREQDYKRVVSVFEFDGREITLVRVFKRDGNAYQLGVTADHLFWMKNVGWTPAYQLGMGSYLELYDGSEALTLCATPIYRTPDPFVGWAIGVWGLKANDGSGKDISFRDNSIIVGEEATFNWEILDDKNESPYFKRPVYGLEVEGFNTYYVGELGVWVRDAN